MTPIDEFNEILSKRKRSFSEVGHKLGPRPGLRLLRFTGDLLRTCMVQDACAKLVEFMDEHLPKDWAIWDPDGELVRLVPFFDNTGRGTHIDQCAIILMSMSWDRGPEGGVIPILMLGDKQAIHEVDVFPQEPSNKYLEENWNPKKPLKAPNDE